LRCSKFAANCITSKNFFRACLTLFSAFEKKTGLFSLSPSAFVHFINQTFIIKSKFKIHLSSYFCSKSSADSHQKLAGRATELVSFPKRELKNEKTANLFALLACFVHLYNTRKGF
jgi:hypothetical protein